MNSIRYGIGKITKKSSKAQALLHKVTFQFLNGKRSAASYNNVACRISALCSFIYAGGKIY